MRRDWILNDLYVAPDFRRRGIAAALLERAIDLAKTTDAKGLTLMTGVDNTAAQRLYEQMGFVRNERFVEYRRLV